MGGRDSVMTALWRRFFCRGGVVDFNGIGIAKVLLEGTHRDGVEDWFQPSSSCQR
jgi:hypothetical protein